MKIVNKIKNTNDKFKKESKLIKNEVKNRSKNTIHYFKKALAERNLSSYSKAMKELKPEISSFKSFLNNLWQSEGELSLKIGITLLSTCLFIAYVAYNKTAPFCVIMKSFEMATLLLIASVFGLTAFAYSQI